MKKSNFIDLIKSAIDVFGRNKITITVILIFGIGLGLYGNFKSTKYFTSEIILESRFLDKASQLSLVDDLERFCLERNTSQLSELLNISEEAASSLLEIEGQINLLDELASNRKLQEQVNQFKIILTLSDTQDIRAIESGLVQFFENNEFVKQRVANEKQQTESLIQTIDNEIQALEKLKELVYQSISNGKGANLGTMDPSKINTEIVNLNILKQQYEKKLKFIEDINIIKSMQNNSVAQEKGIVFYLSFGLLLALVMITVVVGIREIYLMVK